MIPRKLLELWPDAQHIRRSGRCPICRRDSEYSFVLPRFAGTYTGHDKRQWEHCGYWCSCGWSNAGGRPAKPDPQPAPAPRRIQGA